MAEGDASFFAFTGLELFFVLSAVVCLWTLTFFDTG